MIIDDEYIINYFVNKHTNNIIYKRYKNASNDIKEYINKRFNDSSSINESIRRIIEHIEIRPVCKVCGGYVAYWGRHNNIFSNTCSKKCLKILVSLNSKGVKYSNEQKEIIKQKRQKTCLEKYGDKNYRNIEKYKLTCNERFGGNAPACSKKVQEKIKQTCLEKYGVEYAAQLDTNVFKTDNPQKHNNIKEKTKITNNVKYGGNSPACSNNVQDKIRQTCLDKYGEISWGKTQQAKEYLSYCMTEKTSSQEVQDKIKQTCLQKYGVDSFFKTVEYKQFMNKNHKIIQEKINNTKRKNNTFNTSKLEIESYNRIKEKYNDVIYQYKSEKYPFLCDFYIPSLDLYIECNYHWTHGGHPYENNEEDNKIIELWKSKNTKYYDNAIKCWTIRDVNKRNIAKENNLNYIEFFYMTELLNWINIY